MKKKKKKKSGWQKEDEKQRLGKKWRRINNIRQETKEREKEKSSEG